MPVNSTNPEYDANVARWKIVRDVIRSHVKQYIIPIDPTDKKRTEAYRDGARFVNFTARTKNGLVGAVFRKDVVVQLPTAIQYLEDDATGYDMGLTKLAQEVVGEVLQAGRYGLLVDYPASQDGLTEAEVVDLNLAARICRYNAESIINWQMTVKNGIPELSMVVLKEESSAVGEDGFSWMPVCYYRELRMENGSYVQRLWNKDLEIVEEYQPRKRDGSLWNYIPFVFVGAEDNDACVDPAPLYDLSELNIGHLRNSADYEESVRICGQPTFIISSNMSPESFKEANPNGVLIGARRGLNVGGGGSAQFLQANPNQIAAEAMKDKQEQAVMIGARLVQPISANETAEAARMRYTGENSVLSIIAQNVEDALETCMWYALEFMGDESQGDQIEIDLNKEFFDPGIDPQTIMASLQLFNNGIIAKQDLRTLARKTGLIQEDRTDQDIDAEVNSDTLSNPGFILGGNSGNQQNIPD